MKDQEGNEITNLNHIGIINPFRYRSYYYDEETKLYYLNSRYYNPEWGRFLNADGIIGANMDMIGYNLYAYVSNNPVNNSDFTGGYIVRSLNKLKKGITTIFNGAKKIFNTVSEIIKPIKENFVIESGKGLGTKIETNIPVLDNFNVSKYDNIKYQNNEFTCNQTTTQGVNLGIVEIAKEETVLTNCNDKTKISVPQTVDTLRIGPVTVNEYGDVFVGVDRDVNLFVWRGHLKIGWDIPSQKRRVMPGTKIDYSNFKIY